jgi:hypothetical protein
LLPFEGTDTDTVWRFDLPKAANPFDYSTIADVLLTLEYTALNGFDYRQQVIQTLDPQLSLDRPFSFSQQFPDQWYDLNNPDQAETPMIAVLTDRWEMNFEELGIALCRTLTEEPDRLNRVPCGLESAFLDDFVGRQERNEPLNPADLSESIVAAIAEMLREAFSMSRAFAASLVEQHYTGLHVPAYFAVEQVEES